MSRWRTWLPYAVFFTIIALALIVSGLRRAPIRVYTLGVANQSQVVNVNPGGPAVCEGPMTVPATAGAIRMWAAGATGPTRARVTVRRAGDPRAPVLAEDEMTVGTAPDPYTAQLNRPLRVRAPVNVCVGAASGRLELYGAAPDRSAVRIHTGSQTLVAEFSLVFLSADRQSFLGALGTVADRASLFRFGWVGPWTIWLLAAALASAVLAAGVAIARAAAADAGDDGPAA